MVFTKCPIVKQALCDEYEKFGKEHGRKHMTWEECQGAFLAVTMTDEQRVVEMNNLLLGGMCHKRALRYHRR